MALLKLICNTGAKLFVDQEFVSELQENKLCITELSAGMYLVDVVSLIDEKIQVSFELSFENDNQQILKRIDLAEEEKECKQNELKSILMGNPNLSFYRNLARFEYNGIWGYVDNNYEIVVDPIYSSAEDFVNDFALVGKLFSEGMKYALIDTKGKNKMGVWFDDLIFRDEKRLFVRRNNDLLSYDLLKETLFTYNLSGEIKDDDLIPVLWENNYSKKGGYINLRGEVVLPFIYDSVTNFSKDGFAEVERFGYKRYITKEGQVCIYNTIYEIKSNHYFDQGDCLYFLDKQFDWCGPLVWRNGKCGILVKMGDKWGYCLFYERRKDYLKNIIPYEYDAPLYDSGYNFIILRRGRYVCMVNVSDEQYPGGNNKGQYIYGKIGQELFRIEAQEIYPIIEKKSEHIILDNGYSNFIDLVIVNRFVVKQREKYGIIDKRTKQYVLSCEYDDIYFAERDRKRTHVFYSPEHYIIEKSGKLELIDYQGKVLTSLNASDLFHVNDKWWMVSLDNNKKDYYLYSTDDGLMNDSFDEISDVGLIYYLEGYEKHCYYVVKKNNKYGIIDGKGRMVLDCQYEILKSLYLDYSIKGFIVKSERGWGYFSWHSKDEQNNKAILLDCNYDSIEELDSNLTEYIGAIILVVNHNGKKALFINDRFVTDFKYEEFSWTYYYLHGYFLYVDDSFDGYMLSEDFQEYRETLYKIGLDNIKFGLLKRGGEIMMDFIYDGIDVDNKIFEDGMFEVNVKKEGREYIEKHYFEVNE